MDLYKPRVPSLILACLVAGPVFVWTNMLADLYLRLPQPILISPNDIAALLIFSLLATLFGFVLALLPTSLGTLLMHSLGEHVEAARTPLAWTLAGAAIGGGLAMLFGTWPDSPATALALVATSALCARICRRSVQWE